MSTNTETISPAMQDRTVGSRVTLWLARYWLALVMLFLRLLNATPFLVPALMH